MDQLRGALQYASVLEDTSGGELEAVLTTDAGLQSVINDEAFMNEIVVVHVHASPKDDDPPHFILNVNGTNQPVIRGVNTPMRRKYLEVLARMKSTSYSQAARNPMDPESGNTLIPRTSMVYPFELVEDKNPRGRAWLNAILRENQ